MDGYRAVAAWTHRSGSIPEDIVNPMEEPELLTVDEARELIGSTAIALIDCLPRRFASRIPELLAGKGTLQGVPKVAADAVRVHRAALRDVHGVGLAWIIDDQLEGARSYAAAFLKSARLRGAA
jgi:hypothetical protein